MQTRMRALRTALLTLVVGHSPAALATIDLTGSWGVAVSIAFGGGRRCILAIIQTGTALSMSGMCDSGDTISLSGTIDPNTGEFSADGSADHDCPTSLSVSATAAQDGQSFSGSFTCSFFDGSFVGSHCGNGVFDPGEQCDDGLATGKDASTPGSVGNCCSATCQFRTSATICRLRSSHCDRFEVCSGSSEQCPPDARLPDRAPKDCVAPPDELGAESCEHEVLPRRLVRHVRRARELLERAEARAGSRRARRLGRRAARHLRRVALEPLHALGRGALSLECYSKLSEELDDASSCARCETGERAEQSNDQESE